MQCRSASSLRGRNPSPRLSPYADEQIEGQLHTRAPVESDARMSAAKRNDAQASRPLALTQHCAPLQGWAMSPQATISPVSPFSGQCARLRFEKETRMSAIDNPETADEIIAGVGFVFALILRR